MTCRAARGTGWSTRSWRTPGARTRRTAARPRRRIPGEGDDCRRADHGRVPAVRRPLPGLVAAVREHRARSRARRSGLPRLRRHGHLPALRQVDPARGAGRRRLAPALMAAADLAIVGAAIRTLDPARPRASAVAVRDGIVVAVGDDAEVREHAGAATELVDGRGIALVPGLVDSHIHPYRGTDGTRGADLSEARTLDAVRDTLASEHTRCAPGEWLLGWGLSYDAFHGERIGADAIADATGDAPAYVTFFDYHSGLASRPALALAGVDCSRCATAAGAAGAPARRSSSSTA